MIKLDYLILILVKKTTFTSKKTEFTTTEKSCIVLK